MVDLGEILTEEITRLNTEFPAANLIVEFGKLQPVIADKAQMHVLFYQLLSNVVRFRKPGADARAKLLMHTQELNKYRSLEGRYKYTEFIRLELQDSGIGLEAKAAGKAFELFSRLHMEGGTGIGLALCRKIVDMHRGEISISGKEGEGATVSVLLPARIQEHSRHGSIVT
jgi:signal transduction histidine kinase